MALPAGGLQADVLLSLQGRYLGSWAYMQIRQSSVHVSVQRTEV